MKKLATLYALTLSLFAQCQINCDSLDCISYADTSSFEILGFDKESEASLSSSIILVSCKMLCEIEANRSIFSDVTKKINGYTILIYKREEYINSKEE